MSAAELRQRYHRGGTARDDELSAKQLKARYGIASNTKGTDTDCMPMQKQVGKISLTHVHIFVGWHNQRFFNETLNRLLWYCAGGSGGVSCGRTAWLFLVAERTEISRCMTTTLEYS